MCPCFTIRITLIKTGEDVLLRVRLTWIGYLMVRMDGVGGGSMLSDEYVLLRRATLMVCRVRCNAEAASDDDSPCVMGGISCCRNGDC